MAQFFALHPTNPEPRLIKRAVEIVRKGGVIAYPTDSCYAIGCHIGDKAAMERIRRIRGVDERHHFTLVCRDLSEIGTFAKVDNAQYRLLKAHTPGTYTFILQATRELPRRLAHPKRSTVGVRVPEHPATHALLTELDEPLLSSTLILPGQTEPMNDAESIRKHLQHQLDLIIDGGACGVVPTTIIDLSGEAPILVRQGKGEIASFGFTDE
ncbi:MAG: threonylcarbamoyl-AMP synthase [Burkholderiales bacterium]|jgi:tRNA threonylcarbamoyl adenosine modification protein (Sua5/YciO/YrdC/YwlC family)|nr:threonylcarbamoyl-AMP synthase [Burkholderiales bacterium]